VPNDELATAAADASAIVPPEYNFVAALSVCLIVGVAMALTFVETRDWEGLPSKDSSGGHPLFRGAALCAAGSGLPGVLTGSFGIGTATINFAAYIGSFIVITVFRLWRKKANLTKRAIAQLQEAGMNAAAARTWAQLAAEDFYPKGSDHVRCLLTEKLGQLEQTRLSSTESFLSFLLGLYDGIATKVAGSRDAAALVSFLEKNLQLFVIHFLHASNMDHPGLRACLYMRASGVSDKTLTFVAGCSPKNASFSLSSLWPESFGARTVGLEVRLHYANGKDLKSMRKRQRALPCKLVAACPVRRLNQGSTVEGVLCIDRLDSTERWSTEDEALIVAFTQLVTHAFAFSEVSWEVLGNYLASTADPLSVAAMAHLGTPHTTPTTKGDSD